MKKNSVFIELQNLKKCAESMIKKIEILQAKLGDIDDNISEEEMGDIHADSTLKARFISYLQNVVLIKKSSIDDYIKDLKRLRKLILEFLNIDLGCDIIEINNLTYLKQITSKLYNNESFKQYNIKNHHHYSAPLNNYLDFLAYINNSFEFED